MLRIVCLLSCLGAVICGGIGLTEPLLQYPASARTSIAYGNNAFLARFADISAAPGVLAAPLAATLQHGIIAQPLAAHGAITATAAPLIAARTAVATPLAATLQHGVIAQPLAAHTAITATAAPFIAARTAVATPLVSSVHHVPAVAQVPVTKYEAQPAVIQNVVDVANPKVATRKFEIRRPAIQKEFYDIEERVVVRPAGSAVVELDQPISKNQRGPTLVSPATAAAAVRTIPYAAHALHTQAFLPALPALSIQSYPVQGPTLQQPQIPVSGPSPIQPQPIGPSTPSPESDQSQLDDSDSVSIENPELGTARISSQQEQQERQDNLLQRRLLEQSIAQAEARSQLEYQEQAQAQARAQQEFQARARVQAEARAQQESRARADADARAQQEFQTRARAQAQQQILDQQQVIDQLQARLRSQESTQRQSTGPAPVRENIEVNSRSGEVRFGDISLGRSSAQLQEIPSVRNLPEVELSNQARLIALLTERGQVSELRSADGLDSRVRARVLSATPAPPNAEARDEKVSTRRVVVNRPIQTVQEVDVVEPFTKIERVAVHQPAFIKTARLGVAHVPTSLPVHSYTHAHYAF